ncbi:hypothetical protein H7I53_00580 [Mycolicibacterium pulveris]|uniref:Secreted protein n=1 Tax=Mycolicibacterium pulveris TaxID=36813 RepID=A0A7I7UG84_MYCPV|nr:hypothetical protein [Mycolicibacterium pulveris]MCV6978723.1 hypothetical protein [Mycolicibacterium pulveris]BBY80079.1 hypothetical protein MPUL_12370 [Mycolicibacterium pulveris]BBY80080.1 hypothetical protein MPUL_12380 [Mycolicibacterium pulveris]
MHTVSNKVRIATAGAAVAAAAAFAPVAVSHASPAVPAPTGLGSFSAAAVEACNPAAEDCVAAANGSGSQFQNQYLWIGAANPNFQPLLGITFPNFFRLNFEACVLGGALHLSPYGGGFVGIGHGC